MSVLLIVAHVLAAVITPRTPAPKPPKHSGGYFRVYTTPMSEYPIHVFTNGKLFDFRDSGELKAWIETL